jgi:signal transduction histidine kinase
MSMGGRPVLGLRARLMLLVGAGVLVPAALTAWAGLSSVHAVTGQLLRERQSLAAEAQVRAEHAVDEAVERLSSLALPAWTTDEPPQEAVRVVYMHAHVFAVVAVVNAAGAIVAKEPVAYPIDPVTPSIVDTARTARRLGRPAASAPTTIDGVLLHAIAVPLRDRAGALSLAAVGVRSLGERRWNSVLNARQPGQAHVDLVDANGVIVASSETRRLGRSEPPAFDFQSPKHDRDPRVLRIANAEGRETIVAAAPLGVLPWTIAIEQPAASLLAPAVALKRRLLLIVPLMLLVALLFAWGTAAFEESHRELQARDAQRTRLFGRVIAAQEDERRRLARELHDETCQKIAAIGLRLDMAARASSMPAVQADLGGARALVARTLDEVHRVIFDLRPSVLDDLGLLSAIRWLATRQLESAGVHVRCDFPDGLPRLLPHVETALFRAVQEAISNIARHAGAEHVLIEITAANDWLRISIEDDGCGFEVERMTRPSRDGQGLGLLGLRERMQLLNGIVAIDSTPGDGTRVRLDVPLTADHTEAAWQASAS